MYYKVVRSAVRDARNLRSMRCVWSSVRPRSAFLYSTSQTKRNSFSDRSSITERRNKYHIPVLLDEILSFFEDRKVDVYVDGTLGAGGHASAMVQSHPEMTCLVGFDLDPRAHTLAKLRLEELNSVIIPVDLSSFREKDRASTDVSSIDMRYTLDSKGIGSGTRRAFLVKGNFSGIGPVLKHLPYIDDSTKTNHDDDVSACCCFGKVDAMLLDLGISSMQVDEAERGFSFLQDGPLDMRMDPNAVLSAEEIVNTWPEHEIAEIIRDFGEERHWRKIAYKIVEARGQSPIRTTTDLVKAIGGNYTRNRKGKHPATRAFQALRIAVNEELKSISTVLPDAIDALAPGGRLAVITFHSLEDRIVKWAFRKAAGMSPSDEQLPQYCIPFEETEEKSKVKILTRRPITPTEAEQGQNSRSRSAKLRVVEKLISEG